MMLANEDVKMMQYTSAEITGAFLLPELVFYMHCQCDEEMNSVIHGYDADFQF